MRHNQTILLLGTLVLSITANAKAEISDRAPVKPPQTQVAGNSKIQCAGALQDLMNKRYDLLDSRGIDKTNPPDEVMARYQRICRNSYKPIASLEKRLQQEGIVNPRAVLQKAARADDPAAILRANLQKPSKAELKEWQSAFLSLREFESRGPAVVTAEGPVAESAH